MHKEGRMTDEEFEKAKTLIIGSLKTAADKATDLPNPRVEDRPLL